MRKRNKDSLRERINAGSVSERVAPGVIIQECTRPMPTGRATMMERQCSENREDLMSAEELIYETEQQLLDPSKRDCPTCCGEGKISFDNPYYDSMKPIGVPEEYLGTVHCASCRGSGKLKDTLDFMQEMSKKGSRTFQSYLDNWKTELVYDEETESYKDLVARDKK